MLITISGIIVFWVIQYVKFIKQRSPTQARSLQVTGAEVSYACRRQRHPICMWLIKVSVQQEIIYTGLVYLIDSLDNTFAMVFLGGRLKNQLG